MRLTIILILSLSKDELSMEIFRVRTDVYGQNVLEGLNWDLIWVFLGAAVAVIVLHLLFSALGGKRQK